MRLRRSHDDGAGLLSTSVGVLVFLTLLLLAVQVVFALYATSTLTAAAWDAARIAAGSDALAAGQADDGRGIGHGPRVEAERHLRSVLGDYADRVDVTWAEEADDVVLQVRARHPTFLPAPLRRAMGLDVVERTVRVRREGLR